MRCSSLATAQARQHALDMLARAQAVDLMVDAAAAVVAAVEGADLDLISGSGLRPRLECAEDRMGGLQRLHGGDFRPSPPAAQFDLVLVGRFPTLRRGRPAQHGLRGLSGARLGRRGALTGGGFQG
jgi:hypothetical protein